MASVRSRPPGPPAVPGVLKIRVMVSEQFVKMFQNFNILRNCAISDGFYELLRNQTSDLLNFWCVVSVFAYASFLDGKEGGWVSNTVSYKVVKRSFQHPIVFSNPITHRHQAELENIFNGMAHRGFKKIFGLFHLTFFGMQGNP